MWCVQWVWSCSLLSGRDWSLVQRSPIKCSVSGCDREASITRRPWHDRGCWAMGGGKKNAERSGSIWLNILSVTFLTHTHVCSDLNFKNLTEHIYSNVCITCRQILPLNIRSFEHPCISKHQEYKIFLALPQSKHRKTLRDSVNIFGSFVFCIKPQMLLQITKQQLLVFPH